MKLSVVIPCYNESKNLPFIVERAREVFSDMEKVEVLLVNNGSTDDSGEVFLNLISENDPLINVVTVDINEGYGFGILSGLKKAKGEILSWTHADQQTDLRDVKRAYEEYVRYKGDPSQLLVKGYRVKRGFFDKFFSWGMQIYSSKKLKCYMSEINAQPKLFSQDFFQKHIVKDAPKDFSLDLYLVYMFKIHGDIREIPVQFLKRIYGEAKGGGSFKTKWKLILRTLKYINELSLRLSVK